jgi:hypothetical protein
VTRARELKVKVENFITATLVLDSCPELLPEFLKPLTHPFLGATHFIAQGARPVVPPHHKLLHLLSKATSNFSLVPGNRRVIMTGEIHRQVKEVRVDDIAEV